nr:S-methyl-5-thioribose kinase [Lysinibacillus antri]
MFTEYFLMGIEHVKKYVSTKLKGFEKIEDLSCVEIGDGNLNYVFRVVNNATNESVIVKQAGPQARISESIVLSTDRNRIETEVLMLEAEKTPDLVPIIYLYDTVMNCCVMEDLKDFKIMRKELINGKKFSFFSDKISTFMAENLIRTTDFMLDPKEKKKMQKQFINPELCEISEELVFTEPFIDFKSQNILTNGNETWIEKEFYQDEKLHIQVAKLKQQFLTHGQALLHGDLHTGSIFINDQNIKVIDPEFAFYGPIGYDAGNIIANLTFAWARHVVQKEDSFILWVEETLKHTIQNFREKSLKILAESKEPFAKYESVLCNYLDEIIRDSIAFSGLELSRRIIGLAKVADITTIEDNDQRILAERLCLTIAKNCIMDEDIMDIDSYLFLIQRLKKELLVNGISYN